VAPAIFEDFKNIEIFKARDGQEAIDIIKNIHLDIILLDLLMPNVNGIDVLKYIRSNKSLMDIPVIIVTSKESEKKETHKLGANDFISKPYNPEELKFKVFNHLKLKKLNVIFSNLERIAIKYGVTSNSYKKALQEIIKLADGSQRRLLLRLGSLAHSTNGHNDKGAIRVAKYAKLLGTLCGLSAKDVENLYYSMFIYDIGMLRVADNGLSNKEYKLHPKYGFEILNGLKETSLIKLAKIVTLYHHENFDGSGFPRLLRGNEIPIYARIASIADKFDELTSIRKYSKRKMNSIEAMEYIRRDSGTVFDPRLVELFIDHFEKFRDIKSKYNKK